MAVDIADVALDLQIAVQRAYSGGPYRRALDYCETPPPPPLSAGDLDWTEARLREAVGEPIEAIGWTLATRHAGK